MTHQCSKRMRDSDKERNRLMSLMKVHVKLQDFEVKITAKIEESINNEPNPNSILKHGINNMSDIINHHAKARKSTTTWSQRATIVMFCFHPFFGHNGIALVFRVCQIKSYIQRLDVKFEVRIKLSSLYQERHIRRYFKSLSSVWRKNMMKRLK